MYLKLSKSILFLSVLILVGCGGGAEEPSGGGPQGAADDNIAPIASFSASITTTALMMRFDANASSDSDGSIDSYSWDFGDNNTASGVIVNHTYATDGIYNVSLIATDDEGKTASTSQNITVNTSDDSSLAVPSSLSATPQSATQVTLNWGAVANATGFKIERATGGSSSAGPVTVTLQTYNGTATDPTINSDFGIGKSQVNDRNSTWTNVPDVLLGAPWLLTARDDKGAAGFNSMYQVSLSAEATVYATVSPEYNGSAMAFMDGSWTDSGLTATAGSIVFSLWKKEAQAGDLTLGADDTDSKQGVSYIFVGKGNNESNATEFSEITQVGANVTSYSNTGLQQGTQYSYRVRAFNGTEESAYSTIITVTTLTVVGEENIAPVADSQTSLTTVQGKALPIVLSGSDANNDSLTFVDITAPVNGILAGTAPNLTYASNASFSGTDSFTFKVNDGTVDSNNTATVSITVTTAPINTAPTAVNLSGDHSVAADAAAETVIGTLTAEDPDAGDSHTFSIVEDSANLFTIVGNQLRVGGQDLNLTEGDLYQVSIRAVDNGGLEVTERVTLNVISANNINQAPQARFIVNITNIPSIVDFDAGTSHDTDGNIASYSWKFGDNTTGSGRTPTHIYQSPGSYAVELTVTDNEGKSDTSTHSVTVFAPIAGKNLGHKNGQMWSPYLEWSVTAQDESPIESKNFDVVATVTFTHVDSDEKITTEMFYMGKNTETWRFRFTGTRVGDWTIDTVSTKNDLNGLSGTITISENPNAHGFLERDGNKWAWQGKSEEAFVPQFVMWGKNGFDDLQEIDQEFVDQKTTTFMDEHGFTGFHLINITGRWFDITKDNLIVPGGADQTPDRRTFEALETVIKATHAKGGSVHIWAWGDGGNTTQLPKDTEADLRLQRYIAARLGPVPGWTMGYAFDVWEGNSITNELLIAWRDNMHAHLGWSHFLGARGSKITTSLGIPEDLNTALFQGMDYLGYEWHKPQYDDYILHLNTNLEKPSFSEDRFRIRGRAKDVDEEETRRGLWHSTMAGGVANIWGNLGSEDGTSKPYDNKFALKSYSRFFFEHKRFLRDMVRDNNLSTDPNTRVLRSGTDRFVLYRQGASSIQIDLSGMSGPQKAIILDTAKNTAGNHEIELEKELSNSNQTISLDYPSDWAIAIGDF